MKYVSLLAFIFISMLPQRLTAQEITYSEFNNQDKRNIDFEIIGKMNSEYYIYKYINSKHLITVYDDGMHIKQTSHLSFITDKTFNVDFITYPDHFWMVYQYQKNKVVYCMAVKIGADGNKAAEPILLDTTRIPVFTDNKIYTTVFSQDKKKILVSKKIRRNDILTIATKLFTDDMALLDSTRFIDDYDDRREAYGGLSVDNDGNTILARVSKGVFMDNMNALEIMCRKPGDKEYKVLKIDLQEKFIDEAKFKIDNLNKHYLLNAFYYERERGNIKGLFTVVIDAATMDTTRSAFNEFPEYVRSKVYTEGQYKAAFDNLFIRDAIVKKDGGFILTTEDYSSQNRTSNNSWNRNYYLYNSPYMSSYDYYYSPAYGYYRPYNSFNNWDNIRYYYQNILIVSLDKFLRIEWNSVIPKTQSDDDNDIYLSFATLNVGAEIHFLYNDGERNRQIISNQSVMPGGELKRYPTLKSREQGYEFMPRLGKQVGYREMIIPCIFHSNIAFAKVIF